MSKAFRGPDAVFWLVPPDPKATSLEGAYVNFGQPACEAVRSQGVKRVVVVSALGRGTPFAGHTGRVTAFITMDNLIAGTGVSLRNLTRPWFMDTLITQAGAINNQGMFFSPRVPDRKFPTCATTDIAIVLAKLQRWSPILRAGG